MQSSGVTLTALVVSVLLASTQTSFADEARSTSSANEGSADTQAVTRSAQPVDADLIDRLKRAKPLEPLKLKPDASPGQRSTPRLKPNDFGTVTKKLGGDVSKKPASPSVERSLKKQNELPEMDKGDASNYRGEIDPKSAASPNVDRTVFGKDDRVHIKYNNEYPFRTIGLLLMRFGNQENSCSGTLISRRHVLTAAHCIYDVWDGRFADEVTFYPGVNGNAVPFGAYDASYISVLSGYTAPSTADRGFSDEHHIVHDLGVVELSRAAGSQVGWMAYGYDDRLPPFVANIVGYPGDKPFPTMWRASCDAETWDPSIIFQKCDTYQGSSGAGLYDYEKSNQSRTIYGVNSAGNDRTNMGVRITGPYFDWIGEQIGG